MRQHDRLVWVKRGSILVGLLLALPISACGGQRPPAEKQAIVHAPPVESPALETEEPQTTPCPPGSTAKDALCLPCEGTPEANVSEADHKAACVYAEISQKVPGHLLLDREIEGYQGGVSEVATHFEHDREEASTLAKEFEPLANARDAKHWAVMARLRQASLFEVLQIKMESALPPRVNLYTSKETDLLKKADSSGNASLLEMAAQIRSRREEQFQQARVRWLQSVEAPMVRSYAEALLWAKAWKTKTREIDRAKERFHEAVEKLGEEKIKEYTEGLVDPETQAPFVYSPGALEGR